MTTKQHDKEQEQFKRNERLVEREVYCCVTPMVEYILSHDNPTGNEPFTYDDIENNEPRKCGECIGCTAENGDGEDCDDAISPEVYEWWAVSPWLYEQLKAQGEPVIDTFPHLWGRTTTGQAIALDGVISRIEQKLRKEMKQ